MFSDKVQEQVFAVRGGMVWFNHVLIAAVETAGSYQVSNPPLPSYGDWN